MRIEKPLPVGMGSVYVVGEERPLLLTKMTNQNLGLQCP